MIARQRDNLNRTFQAREREDSSSATRERLARNGQEIHDATREFAAGLAAQVGPVLPLETAAVAMSSAVEALEAGDLAKSVELETSALADLVLARRNLRQILKQSNGQQASMCRSFDRQQHQKLRPPEKPPEPQQSVAELREQLEQLAEQQRKFSEEVRSGSPQPPSQQPQDQQQAQSQQSQSQAQSQSQSAQASSAASQSSPADAQAQAEQQRQAAEQAAELRDQLAADRSGSELSQQRLDEAAEAIRQSAEEAAAERGAQAAAEAERAAGELDRLAEHLAELNAADLAARLQGASRLARELADRQQALAAEAATDAVSGGKSDEEGEASGNGASPEEPAAAHAAEQGELAALGEELAEVVDRLMSAAAEEATDVADRLAEATAVDPPSEAAGLMRDAEGQFRQGDSERAAASARLAGEMLARLAAGLDEAQRQFAQPQLDELLAAEERVAELLAEMERAQTEAERELVRAQIEELLHSLARAAAGSQALQDAVREALAQAGSPQALHSSDGDGAEREQGIYESGRVLTDALREVAAVLQTQIQEAILAAALADPNAAVPPQYQKMVDEYYRVLSEDLRE